MTPFGLAAKAVSDVHVLPLLHYLAYGNWLTCHQPATPSCWDIIAV
ncbi:hypothetical protein [Vibrio sp. V28_P6S34P95]|nr:hypothetical protein [Vibrio sp. V28_P6S34P95]NAW70697.1 hypothetical protein [Vibrio sp. V28_P6S34P95]